jgi:hypothetical protein
MRVFWSVLTVMGALSATAASAANWNERRYAPVGIVDRLERGTVWQRGVGEPEPAPIVLAEARKPTKRGASGAARAAFDGRWSVIISTRSGPLRSAISLRCADYQREHHLRGRGRGERSRTGLIQRQCHSERSVGAQRCQRAGPPDARLRDRHLARPGTGRRVFRRLASLASIALPMGLNYRDPAFVVGDLDPTTLDQTTITVAATKPTVTAAAISRVAA